MRDLELPQIQRVIVRRRTGRGGMADVYLGIHESLQRPVAVKILHSHLVEEEDVRRRFHAEAKAVSGLRHPNIVQVYDFGLLDGRPYIIMEFVDGPSLAGLLQARSRGDHSISTELVVDLVIQVASALDYAHARGIVHRDVKPANILLRRSDSGQLGADREDWPLEAVLSDFGVARLAQSTAATLSGTILGTPAYMGPEQVMGGAIDSRTDIYSLGVVLYEMLTGVLPFRAPSETPAAMLFQHVHGAPPPLPDELSRLQLVIDRALAKNPADRYTSARDLADELRRRLSADRALATGTGLDRATHRSPLGPSYPVRRLGFSRPARLGILGLFLLLLLAGGAFSLPRLLPGLGGEEGLTQPSPTSTVGSPAVQGSTPLTTGLGTAAPTSGVAAQETPGASPVPATPTLRSSATARPSSTSTPRPSATPPPTSTPEPSPTATDLLDILTPVPTLLGS